MHQFYIKHSIFSQPGEYGARYHDLPQSLSSLIASVNNLFFHYADQLMYAFPILQKQFYELDLRTIQDRLECLLQKSKISLNCLREHHQKVLGACRDSALLLCSVLRQRGIPARLRAGFNTYYNPQFYLDGFCLQYYDSVLSKWITVDPRTTEQVIHFHHLNIDFDLTDLSENHFIPAAKAWQLCRRQQASANQFGYRHFSGLNYIRNKVIQDFLLLNKYELLIWDLWGMMLDQSTDSYDFIDTLAEFLTREANDPYRIQEYYQKQTILQLPSQILVANPFLPERWEILPC